MKLIEPLWELCARLAVQGWATYLLENHGLNIIQENPDALAAELQRELPHVRRDLPGFGDFAREGKRGIEPGSPTRSLLYHALASPCVVAPCLTGYPTLSELDLVENAVYAAANLSLPEVLARAEGAPTALVVFACEYRPGAQTPHRCHADMCYSRTGAARVGNHTALYEADERGYLAYHPEKEGEIPALPARYAAYIAAQRAGSADILGAPYVEEKDTERPFWVPLHKVFAGEECLRGLKIELTYEAHHQNEKLRRFHQVMRDRKKRKTGWDDPFLDQPPFRFTEGIASLERIGDSALIVPEARPLIEAATYNGRPLTFRLPIENDEVYFSNLYVPTEQMSSTNQELRFAPQVIAAIHALQPDGTARNLSAEANVSQLVGLGGYQAQHYLDFTADGWVRAICPQLASLSESVPAYSLVTAPDFFPRVSQRAIGQWARSLPPPLDKSLWATPPDSLADQRFAPNIALSEAEFRKDDQTVSAVLVTGTAPDATPAERGTRAPRRHSALPDSAAGVFAPGWDIALSQTDEAEHLANYGLASPFVEDVKLCAALSAFWPAASPDTARVYEPQDFSPTLVPLLDEEIGWDGVPGPRRDPEGKWVEYVTLANTDYLSLTLNRRLSLRHLAEIDEEEYIRRTLVMLRVYRVLGVDVTGENRNAEKSRRVVLSFRRPRPEDRAERELAEAQTGRTLREPLYRFEVYERGAAMPAPTDARYRRVAILSLSVLYVDSARALLNRDGQVWETNDS